MQKTKAVRQKKVATDTELHGMPAVDSPGSRPEYRVEEQIGFVIRRAHQRASLLFQRIMKESGVSPTQFAALVKARDKGRLSQNELGRMTYMDPATTMGVIMRLVDRDLLRRHPDPIDRRKMSLSITAKGLALVEVYEACAYEVSRETLAPLGEEEKRTLLSLLARIT